MIWRAVRADAAEYPPDSGKALRGRPFLSLLRYNLPYWPRYLGGAVLAMMFVGVGLVVPLVVRSIVHAFETGAMTRQLLALYFFGLLAIAVAEGVARYFRICLALRLLPPCAAVVAALFPSQPDRRHHGPRGQ